MTRIRFQGSIPHVGYSQPFWAPRLANEGPLKNVCSLRTFKTVWPCRSGRSQEGRDLSRVLGDRHAGIRKGLRLRLCCAFSGLDDRPRVPHPFAGGRGASCDVGDHGFRHFLFDEVCCLFFCGSADFADEDDPSRFAVLLEQRQSLDHIRAVDRIPADAHAGRLTETRLAHRVYDLVGERAAPGYHAGVPFFENEVRDDAHLRLPRGSDAGAVRPDHRDTLAASVGDEVEAIVKGNALRNDHDELDPRFDCLYGRILRVRGGDEQDRRVRLSPEDRIPYPIKDGNPLDLRAGLAWRHAGHDLRPKVPHRTRMELPLMTRDALDDNAGLLCQEDGQLRGPPPSASPQVRRRPRSSPLRGCQWTRGFPSPRPRSRP